MSDLPGYDAWKLREPDAGDRDCGGCDALDAELHAASERIEGLKEELECAQAALRVCATLLQRRAFNEDERREALAVIARVLQ